MHCLHCTLFCQEKATPIPLNFHVQNMDKAQKGGTYSTIGRACAFNQRVRGSNPRWLTRHRPSGNGRPFALPVSRDGRGAASHLRTENGQMGDADAPPTPIC